MMRMGGLVLSTTVIGVANRSAGKGARTDWSTSSFF